jgi:hypothetical protein
MSISLFYGSAENIELFILKNLSFSTSSSISLKTKFSYVSTLDIRIKTFSLTTSGIILFIFSIAKSNYGRIAGSVPLIIMIIAFNSGVVASV